MPSDASSTVDLTNKGKRSFFGTRAAAKDCELRRWNAVEGQQLLAERFVARQHEAPGVAPRIGLAQELEKCHDVLIVGDDPVEFFEQIENDLWPPFAHDAAQLGKTIENADAANLVTQLAQRARHVIFRTPLVDLPLGIAVERFGREKT